MKESKAFDQMKRIIELPTSPLQSYKQDFYKADLEILTATAAPGVVYAWVVRENGTHLIVITHHARPVADLVAIKRIVAEQASQTYLVTIKDDLSADIVPSTVEAMITRAEKLEFTVDGHRILHNKEPIASFSLSTRQRLGDTLVKVDYQQCKDDRSLTMYEQHMLNLLAHHLAVDAAHTLFAKVEEVCINGVPVAMRKDVTLDGLFVGAEVRPGVYAEQTDGGRWMIRVTQENGRVKRRGDIMGSTGRFQACTSRGRNLGVGRTFNQALDQLLAA